MAEQRPSARERPQRAAGDPRPPARERLLRATSELTYASGIHATGVDAIAKRADVTKRTLYQHFSSKDELVGAALAAADPVAAAGLRGAVERRIARGERPLEALFAVLVRIFAQPGYQGCAFLNAGLEAHSNEHPVRAAVRSHTDARRALVAELVRAEGIEDEDAIATVALLVEGAFALSAGRRDHLVAETAAAAARRTVESARRRGT